MNRQMAIAAGLVLYAVGVLMETDVRLSVSRGVQLLGFCLMGLGAYEVTGSLVILGLVGYVAANGLQAEADAEAEGEACPDCGLPLNKTPKSACAIDRNKAFRAARLVALSLIAFGALSWCWPASTNAV
jgi:hypothetical protein